MHVCIGRGTYHHKYQVSFYIPVLQVQVCFYILLVQLCFYTRDVGNFLHVHTLDVPMFLNALDEGTCILVCFYMLSMTVYISTCFRCYCRYVFTCFRCRYVSTYFRCSYISTYMYFRYRYVSYILVLQVQYVFTYFRSYLEVLMPENAHLVVLLSPTELFAPG